MLHRKLKYSLFLTASVNCGPRNTYVCSSSDFNPNSLENAFNGGLNAKHFRTKLTNITYFISMNFSAKNSSYLVECTFIF